MKIHFPSLSLLEVRARFPEVFYVKDSAWYDDEPFAKEKIPAGEWEVSLEPIPDSFNKTYDEQKALLKPGEEIPPIAVLAYAVAMHRKEGKYAFESCYIRTSSSLAFFGIAGAAVADVSWCMPDRAYDNVGVVSARRLNFYPLPSNSIASPDEADSIGAAIEKVRAAGYLVFKEY